MILKKKKIVKIRDIIIPKYYPLFNDKQHMHHILTSGRAGTKSSYMGIKAVYSIISEEKCSVIVLRKRHNKLRKTVYKEVLRAITRLGLKKSQFKITKSPMEITYKKNGNTIYFTGSDSVDDTKGIIDEERPIKLVILDELTEFFDSGEGKDELETSKQRLSVEMTKISRCYICSTLQRTRTHQLWNGSRRWRSVTIQSTSIRIIGMYR